MKTVRKAVLAGMLLLAASGAWAGVTVTYAQPEQFSDVPFAPWERERVLKELSKHFAKMAQGLPAGQDLAVEVTDIDLAGRTWPSFDSGRDIRVLNGRADWPQLSMKYTVTQNGQVVRQGEEHLNAMNYLNRFNRYTSSEELRYEKQMLDDWFKERIISAR